LNEIVPVSHPIFWFGTILAQKSNNKNYQFSNFSLKLS